ncbi:hypothetical protein ACM1RC_18870 [Paenibacillus azoreducens]|uniref:hypothetical protein n=1 Tax=Paenibacillus azoreducens TaxID=116718 RepID=UPI0039F53E47
MSELEKKRRYPFPRIVWLAALMGLVTAAFLGMIELYTHSLNREKTVVMDPALFAESKLAGFRVESVVKQQISEPVKQARLLSNNALLYWLKDNRSADGTGLHFIDLTTGRPEVYQPNEPVQNAVASADGTKAVYTTYSAGDAPQIVYYDIVQKKVIRSWQDWSLLIAMPDDRHSLELLGLDILLRDLNTGQARTVASLNSSGMTIPKNDLSMVKWVASPDQSRIYVSLPSIDQPTQGVLLSIVPASGVVSKLAEGEVHDLSVLGGGSLLVSGQINGQEGLFKVDEQQGLRPVKQGSFQNIAATPNEDGVAYSTRTADGQYKLMAARMEGNRLVDETTVYSDPGYVRILQWKKEEPVLVCMAEGISGTDVYQFRFGSRKP